MLYPECGTPVEDVVEYGNRNEDVSRRAALQVLQFSLLVLRWIHGRRKIDHPRQDRLDHGVVHEIDRETNTAEEVEDGGAKELASGGGEEYAK